MYNTYTQAFAVLLPAVILCAWVTRAHRTGPMSGSERWGWRIALTGYALATIGIVTVALVEINASPNGSAVGAVFIALMVPGMLITAIGSTVLGIGLLRSDYTPKLTAWLLALAIPFQLLGTGVLGHNSIGMVALFAAWGVTGWHLWRTDPSPFQEPAANTASMSL